MLHKRVHEMIYALRGSQVAKVGFLWIANWRHQRLERTIVIIVGGAFLSSSPEHLRFGAKTKVIVLQVTLMDKIFYASDCKGKMKTNLV